MKITPWLVLILGGLAMLGPLGTDIYLVALPVMADDLSVTGAVIQLTLSTYTIGMALGQLVIGGISDRLGRRRILMAGLVLMAVAAGFASLAQSAVALIIACGVMGAASATGLVSGRAVVSDLTAGPAATRAFSFLALVTGLGPMLGPVVGAICLAFFGWRSAFVFMSVYALIMLVLVYFFVGESLPPQNRVVKNLRGMVVNYVEMFRDPLFTYHALTFWCVFGTIFSYLAASSFMIQGVLGQSSIMFTLTFASTAVTSFLTGMASTYFAKFVSARTLIGIGLTIMALGAIMLSILVFTDSMNYSLYLTAFILMVGVFGLIAGPSNAMALTRQRHRGGTAFSLMGFLQWGSAALAGAILAAGGTESGIPFALTATAGTALAIVFFLLGRKPAAAMSH